MTLINDPLGGLNPMEAEFYGPENSYPHLDHDQQPYVKARQQQQANPNHQDNDDFGCSVRPVKVHVTNVPLSLTANGLRNIINRCADCRGSVVDVYLHTRYLLTYISLCRGLLNLEAFRSFNSILRSQFGLNKL